MTTREGSGSALSPVVAIVQARMESTRFPGKVMQVIGDVPMIEFLLHRLSRARRVDRVVVATSTDPSNAPLAAHVRHLGYDVFEGSERDVLDRYYQAAKCAGASTVVRITADCPLIDAAVVDLVIEDYARGGADYVANTSPPTFPDGLDTEVFSFTALERAAQEAVRPFDREHVTPFLRESGLFSTRNVTADGDWSARRWTVDEPVDLEVVSRVVEAMAPDREFSWLAVRDLQDRRPELFTANEGLRRNEGAAMGTGQKLWRRAKRLIPGGSMLFSKRAELFLPEQWPAYFSRASGCRVWDLDDREYVDMSLMGVGTNTLGYAHPEVDDAVRGAIARGTMSTLNCREEVDLAERLVTMNPWSEMVRFTRSGGEANAVAVRIARAASGRDSVAFCGYHGWHDWYLAANLSGGDVLQGHLLPGLDPGGVPRALQGSIVPFNYNDYEGLCRVVEAHDVGVIVMEVARNQEPADGFLGRVRDLASRKRIVLMFDECTSAFRQTFGGLHTEFGVEPDLAMYGKAISNGYALNAIVGRREVMEAAQSTFISSTFWTERIGPTAALKTLEVMERVRSWERITETGKAIKLRWLALAAQHGVKITTFGLPALAGFSFHGPQALAYKTLLTQMMLEQGYLATTSIYCCTEHTTAIVNQYFEALEPVFKRVGECEDGRDVMTLLKGPVCHASFGRLN